MQLSAFLVRAARGPALCVCLTAAFVHTAFAQDSTTPAAPAVTEPAQPAHPPGTPAAPAPAQQAAAAVDAQADKDAGAITEDQLRQMLTGKELYLRGGYLDDSLAFDEQGRLAGHSPQGSYTLCMIVIDKVRLSKHKVELTGARYGLHFLGALPNEDPTKAVDRVRITPKKKIVHITIDRELVVIPKKKKGDAKAEAAKAAPAAVPSTPAPATATGTGTTPAQEAAAPAAPDAATAGTVPAATAAPAAADTAQDETAARAEMAAAPEAERPADAGSVTTTISPAHAAQMLRTALDTIFATGIDDKLIASMPDFWKLYYQAAARQSDYVPASPGILRQNDVDQKAKLTSTFIPPSNEFAQAGGVAGMAMYHAVIGADGKVNEVVVGRPIGFGLDESAADTIRKASFQPAMKNGQPVPVMIDLVVQFRIYSKRTDRAGETEAVESTPAPKLPGPYSVQHQ